MNKRQALLWVENTFFGDLDENQQIENLQCLINKIFNTHEHCLPKQKIVCLCGSTRFKDEFEKANRVESLKGNIVLTVAQFSHYDKLNITDDEKSIFDRLHFSKIELADELLVIDVDGYIGESTQNEINYGNNLSKQIRYNSKELL